MVNDLAAQSHQEQYPGAVIRVDELDHSRFLFVCQNGVRLFLHVLSDKILRFRYLTDGPLSTDFSYAVPADATARMEPALVEFREKPDHYRITTERLICTIQKESLKARVLDRSGTILSDDEKGFHWEYDYDSGNDIVKMSKQVPAGVHYYGLATNPTT